MKIIFTSLLVFLLSVSTIFAQNNIDFDASQSWIGFMNVFNLETDGGAYQFGSPWEVPLLKSTINVVDNSITLQPNFNTYAENATDAFWVNQTTMEGNKNMEALTFVEPGTSFNEVDLTFSGSVVKSTLAEGYTAYFFIKALDPTNDYQDALGDAKVLALPASGSFSVSATAAELANGLLVQYGFSIRGTNANPAEEAALGGVVISSMSTSTKNVKAAAAKVAVSPNPADGLLSIRSEARIASFEIRNLSGQVMLSGTDSEVDVANLSSGIYVVLVDLGDRREAVKFVKN